MNRYEKQKLAVEKAMGEKVKAYQAIYKKADDEDRDPTEDERLEVESHLKAIEVLKKERTEADENIKTLQGVEDIGRELGPALSPSMSVRSEPQDRILNDLRGIKSIGEMFTDSAGYKSAVNQYRETGRLSQGFSTGAIAMEAKGTLLEGAGGGGGPLAAPVPQVLPGVVEKLFQPLTFADLLLSGQATVNSLRYVVEGTATSGAAGVAEGGSKPQSTLGLTTTDEPIKKIATSLKISDEMLEDAPAIQSYINGRLSLFVRIEEERQLLRGTSGGNEVQGILTSRSVPVYAGGTAVGNRAVQVFKAMNGLRGSAFLEPEWIVMHPTDWETTRLLTDTAGQYFGGGPFQGQYGNGQNMGASGQINGIQDYLWNKPVYVTGIIGAGTALVGTQSSAQVWRKGGLSVEITNANEDDFLKNLLAVRAEERVGLAVYRPTGYVEVRLA
ncbi:MAG TPA: phage major capsid protein [Vicinamibacterales bacterium]|nr:phage major capsid protein [Vicinamibacterales bacterium]